MRFKREKEDDIILIFEQIDDRIFDIDDRIKRLTADYENLVKENVEIQAEITDIN